MSLNKKMPYLVGFVIFCLESAFGIWMTHWNHFIPGDAISRVANAYYVLFSRDPHLGAIGFVWNPLPSLLMIPLLLVTPWVKIIASEGIAGILLTSVFASCTAMLLLKSLLRRKQPLLFSCAFVFLFSFNPFMFLYGSNGMSEMIFIFFIILCVTAFTDWMDDRRGVSPLITMGFALALAFLTRYESVLFGAALALSLTVMMWSRRQEAAIRPYGLTGTYHKWEAGEWIALLPAIYTGVIWIALNGAIMGDGLFFLRSSYSNLAQSEGLSKNPTVSHVIGDPAQTLLFVVERSLPFMLPLIAVCLIRVMRRKLFSTGLLCLLILLLSIPVMQIYMLYKGASYGWLRFFVYPFVITLAWLPFELHKLKEKASHRYIPGCCLTLIILSGSACFTGYTMSQERLSPEEYQAIHYHNSPTYLSNRSSLHIAKDLDQLLQKDKKATLLLDSFNGFQIILNMDRTRQLIVTSDLDFKKKLNDPAGEQVDYILVPKPEGVATLNAVNERYKNSYYKGAIFAKLYKAYDDKWRLYRVVKSKE
ncbi:hypothetical protein ABNN70_05740 [Sporolactobacillus sp. Y61]|uniref:Glycosyltransferase RgtA/B/C/D-like domain-containing protein n=1 Tax=Sporolactobacillus sp. Y61 TaxID=3160863 RepID=A0AAU8II96_9BACL